MLHYVAAACQQCVMQFEVEDCQTIAEYSLTSQSFMLYHNIRLLDDGYSFICHNVVWYETIIDLADLVNTSQLSAVYCDFSV